MSLDEARAGGQRARAQRVRGEDPRAATPVCKIVHIRSFEHVARLSHADIQEITPSIVVKALRAIKERGRLETARRVRQRILLFFEYAIAEGLAEIDPAARVGRALMPP